MFESIMRFFKRLNKTEKEETASSKEAAKERLHLVLMQDRANVSADFLELMKQEIIEVIKKYIDVDEKEIDVRLTNRENEDGTNGAPALYANIPIINIKNDTKKINLEQEKILEKDNSKDMKQKEKEEQKEEKKNKENDSKVKIEENSKEEKIEEKQKDVTNLEDKEEAIIKEEASEKEENNTKEEIIQK